jgi:rSAM/selenodomain-associated transferase 1
VTEQAQLILFLKAPRLGAVKTRLAAALGPEAACAAYRVLVDRLVTQLAGIDGVELRFAPDEAEPEVAAWQRPGWSTVPQGAGDLGMRLHRAFAEAFARGCQRVAVIGSDCPDIQPADIQAAWLALDEVDVVLGPARDGGYWLIGLPEPQPDLFTNMPWSSDRVLAETLARCRTRQLKCRLLRELTDVDELEQWQDFQRVHLRPGRQTPL